MSLKAWTVFIFKHFSCYEHLKFYAQLSWARKKFYNLGAWSGTVLKGSLQLLWGSNIFCLQMNGALIFVVFVICSKCHWIILFEKTGFENLFFWNYVTPKRPDIYSYPTFYQDINCCLFLSGLKWVSFSNFGQAIVSLNQYWKKCDQIQCSP